MIPYKKAALAQQCIPTKRGKVLKAYVTNFTIRDDKSLDWCKGYFKNSSFKYAEKSCTYYFYGATCIDSTGSVMALKDLCRYRFSQYNNSMTRYKRYKYDREHFNRSIFNNLGGF